MYLRKILAINAVILVMLCLLWGGVDRALGAGPEEPGDYFRLMDLKTGGFQRRYHFHVPPGYHPGKPLPLVIALHGAFSSGKQMARRTGLNRLADREHFLVLYPEGIGLFGFLQHWNAGHCCGKAWRDGIDDTGFIDAAFNDVAADVRVDQRRVYLLGYSNGGMMAHRLAAAMPKEFAAVAVVAGSVGSRSEDGESFQMTPHAAGSVPIMMIHGRRDTSVPYDGGRSARGKSSYASVRQSAGFWVKNNQDGPISVTRVEDGYSRQVWTGLHNTAPVEVISIDGWGHDWPGYGNHLKNKGASEIDITEMIWHFFRRHRRP